ncbi:YdeI family protein [Parapedobacter sp. 2B3]|uniref:YdeI/OmpD-associated family protein n=1 Tax=Parapedobacter sp. 2B3 TaxID=3342381 RepID=UPI0035B579E6
MGKTPNWQEELGLLRAIIAKTALVETTKWGIPVYTYNGRNVVGVAGFKNHFTLWFYQGVFLKDKMQVLTTAPGGKAKAMRQWRFTAREQINEPQLLSYLNEAIANEKAGLQLKPEPKGQLLIPAILSDAFKDNGLRKAFDVLAPYKQREYIEYLTEAKREATKLARLDKIRPLILAGAGLHDQYKK